MKKRKTDTKKQLSTLFQALLIFGALGILGYRLGAEWLFWPLIINTVVIVLLGVILMPGALLTVFGSIFLLILLMLPALFISLYLLSSVPVIGEALRANPPEIWALLLAIVVVFLIAIGGGFLYVRIETFLSRRLMS